jgi:hypothetical protein
MGVPCMRSFCRAALLVTLVASALGSPAFGNVLLFGPKTYSRAAGQRQAVTESFAGTACDLDPRATWTLTVTNGAADGSQRISSGTITLNGVPVVTQNDFSQQVALIERTVSVQAANSLTVDLEGGKQNGRITLSIQRHIDIIEDVVAKTKLVTTTAKSDSFRTTFSASNPGDAFTLVLKNGDGTAASVVKSGAVTLNGVEVVSSQGFPAGGELRRTVTLNASNDLLVTLTGDRAGEFVSLGIIRHVVDAAGPVITFANLHDGQVFGATPLSIAGMITDTSGAASLTINGNAVAIGSGGAFAADVALSIGPNRLVIDAADCEGNTTHQELAVRLDDRPVVTITTPAGGFATAQPSVQVSGSAVDDGGLASFTVNGQPVTVGANGAWSTTIAFGPSEGAVTVTAAATDLTGKQGSATIQLFYDKSAPVITLGGEPPAITYGSAMLFFGHVTDAVSRVASITCNGVPALVDGDLFNCTPALAAGDNTVTIAAADIAGNATSLSRTIKSIPDNDLPTITATVTPQPNAAGWLRTFATLSFQCSDATSGISFCPAPSVASGEGTGLIFKAKTADKAGHEKEVSVTLNIDGTAPNLIVNSFAPLVRTSPLTLSGTAHDAASGLASVTCNGQAATLSGDSFSCSATLARGGNSIRIAAVDKVGNLTQQSIAVTLDNVAPSLALDAPLAGQTLNAASVEVSGGATDDDAVASVTVNGANVTLAEDGTFVTTVALGEGTNSIVVAAKDPAGNTTSVTRSVTRFSVPTVAITSPADFAVVGTATVTVAGNAGPTVTSVDVNGSKATVSAGHFTASNVPLQQGRTVITATARDASARLATSTIQIYRDSIPPRVTVVWPAEGATVGQNNITVSGNVDDIVVGTINPGQVRVTVNNVAATVSNRAFTLPVTLAAGANTLNVVATDSANNSASAAVHVTYSATQPRVVAVSGGDQSGIIGSTLPAPLVARLINAAGQPVANAKLTFTVVENDGTLGGARTVEKTTNAQGEASVNWTLGHRAGSGNQQVAVSATGAAAVEFIASGTSATPSLIVVDSGNGQFGAVSAPLPRPLVAIVVDAGFNRIAGVPVTFSVSDGGGNFAGASSQVVTTDSDGRAIARPNLGPESGSDNNLFTARVAGSASGASFTASGRTAGAPSATAISGVVLDNTDKPIAGVSVRVDGTSLVTQTDAQGLFRIASAPVGYVRLFVDGSTAQRGGTWPTLEFALYTIAGQDNPVGMPIYLLPIDIRRGLFVDDTTGGTLTLPELPGFSITVKPGSATFPGGGRTGTVSATLVHYDKVPMAPAFGQQPRFVVTIQPAGTHFDPPAAVTFPNLEGLPAGSITELFSFDHDLGQFVSIGSGSVSEDGSTVKSDPGVGIIKGGWHGSGNPAPTGTAGSLTVSLSGQFDGFDPNASTTAPVSSRRVTTTQVKRRARSNAAAGGPAEDVTVGSTYVLVASGEGAANGQYVNWEPFDDPGDPDDNPGCAHFVSQPTCDGQPTCAAKIIGDSPGVFSARVTFRNTTTNKQTTSQVCKVRFVKFDLKVKSVSFKGPGGAQMIKIYKDLRSPAPSVNEIVPPQWQDGATPKSDPVLYVRKDKMRVDLEVEISNVQPPGAINHVLIDGVITGIGKFHKTNVTLAASGTTTVSNVDFDQPLPDTTRYYPDAQVFWKYQVGSTLVIDYGSTKHDIFVALAPPVANRKLYLTSVKLALKSGTENNVTGAFQRTWQSFAGPANIQTWDNSPIRYYATGFNGSLACGATQDEAGILMAADAAGSSQCTGAAAILQGSLAVNGMDSELVHISRADGAFFMVKKWTFGFPSLNLSGSAAPPALWPFRWRIDFGGPPPSMVPPPIPADPTKFGDVRNDLSGLPGQNTSPPAEKIFGNHVYVLPHLVDNSSGAPVPVPTPGGPYFDASYGVTYSSLADFVSKAVAGIITQQLNFNGYPNSKGGRPVQSSDASDFQLCTFATAGSVPCTTPTP